MNNIFRPLADAPETMREKLADRLRRAFEGGEYWLETGQTDDPKDITNQVEGICAEYGWTMKQFEQAVRFEP